MTFRGQNYLSGAIRRVGQDVAGLSRAQQLSVQQSSLQLAARRLATTKQIASAEQASIIAGSRNLSLIARRNGLSNTEIGNQMKLRNIYSQQEALQASLMKNQTRMQQVSAALYAKGARGPAVVTAEAATGEQLALAAEKGPVPRTLGRMNVQQLTQEAQAALLTQESLRGKITTTNIAIEQQNKVIGQESVAAQKLAATQAEWSNRLGVLQGRIDATTIAEDKNTLALRQNAIAMDMLPWQKFQSGAAQVEHASRVVQMFSLIAAAGFGYAAEQASKFNTAAILAATQIKQPGMSQADIAKYGAGLQTGIQQMMLRGQTISPFADLTQGAYRLISGLQLPGGGPQQIKEAISLLKELQGVAKANYGLVTFDDVVSSTISIMRDFNVSIKNLPSALNTMQAAVKYGRMTMGEFLKTFNQAAPSARAAQQSFGDMAGTIAYLSTKFPSVQMAGTGYARLLEVITQNAQKFNAAGAQVTDSAGRILPLQQIVANMVKQNPEIAKGGTALANYFKTITGQTGRIQARRVFTFLAEDLAGYQKILRQTSGDTTALTKAQEALGKTPAVRWAQFVQQLHGVIATIGTGAIPAFQSLAKGIGGFFQWFDKLNPKTKEAIGYWGTMITVGALLVSTFTALFGGAARLALQFGTFLKFRGPLKQLAADATTLAQKASQVAPEVAATAKTAAPSLAAAGERVSAGGVVIPAGVSAEAAIASKTLGNLGNEAGSVRASLAGGLGLVSLMPTLIIFHKQIGYVVDKIGGLGQAIRIVSLAITAFTLTKMIGSFRLLTGEALATATAMERVQLMFGILSALGTAYIGVTIIESIIRQYLPGLGSGEFKGISPQIGPQNFAQAAQHDASTRAGLRAVRQRAQTYTGQGQQIFTAAENLLSKGLDPNKVYAQLRGKYKTAGQEFLVQVVADANTLMKAVSHKIAPKTPAEGTVVAKQVESVNQWISRMEKLSAAMIGSPSDLQKAKAFEAAQAALNKQFKGQPALLAAINDILGNYNSNLKSTTKSANTLGVTFQDVLSSMQSKFNAFQQQEQGIFGTLFSGPYTQTPQIAGMLQWGGQLSGKDLFKDLKSQITQFSNFHGILNKLSREGAPYELIQQLMALGPASIKQIRALSTLSKPELDKYFQMFRTSQQDINKQSMKDLQLQLKQYRKYGQQIALQIVAGLRDENVQMTNAITGMIKKMFPGLPVGATGAGGRPTHHPVRHTPTVHTENNTYNVHTTATPESVKTQLKHAEFAKKNKYRIGHPVGP